MDCNCDKFIINTGLPSRCRNGEPLPDRVIIVPHVDKNGVRNGIPISTLPVPDDTVSDLINNTDRLKRFYPIDEQIYTFSRGENEPTEDTVDDTPFEVRKGAKNFSWVYKEANINFAAIMESIGCSKFDIYFTYRTGAIQGVLSKDKTMLYGMEVNNRTFRAPFSQDSSTVGTISVSALFDVFLKYKDIVTLSAEAFVEDLTSLNGLVDVYGELVGTPTTTEIVVDLKTNWGTYDNPLVYEGALAADIRFIDDADADITKTVTESTTVPGRYTITPDTALTSADVVRVGLEDTVKGYEMELFSVTIP